MRRVVLPVALLLVSVGRAPAQPVTTAFTYQGELRQSGAPAAGPVDLRFRLFALEAGGVPLGALDMSGVGLSAGRFSVPLDFGPGQLNGQRRWVEVSVAPAGSGVFTTLSPRQELTAAPYATFAVTSTNAATLGGQAPSFYTDAANLTGALADTVLSLNIPRLNGANTFAGTVAAPSFSGSGAPLTGLNAGNIALGLLPDARLSGNIPRINSPATAFTGTLTAAAFVGSGGALTGLDAANIGSGILADGRLSGNVALRGAGNTFTATNLFTGNVGIGPGLASPEDRLHVYGGDAGVVASNTGARIVIEDDATAYLNFMTPSGSENGVLFGLGDSSSASGGIVYNNSACPLGMQFRTGGNLTRLTIDSGGFVGINTVVPDAPLHVNANIDVTATGGGSLVVGVDTANVRVDGNEVQALSSGAPANIGLQVSGGNVGIGTLSPSGKLHVVGGTGNGAVVLPTGSISAEEIGDEMGVVADIGSDATLTSGVLRTLATRTISVPRDGFVIAIASFEVRRNIQSGSDVVDASVGLDNTDPFAAVNRRVQLAFDSTFGSSFYFPCTFQGVFGVTAGSNTFYIIAQGNASPATVVRSPHLSLIFVPTSYGTVDVDNP